jgi:hypothetical protein
MPAKDGQLLLRLNVHLDPQRLISIRGQLAEFIVQGHQAPDRILVNLQCSLHSSQKLLELLQVLDIVEVHLELLEGIVLTLEFDYRILRVGSFQAALDGEIDCRFRL